MQIDLPMNRGGLSKYKVGVASLFSLLIPYLAYIYIYIHTLYISIYNQQAKCLAGNSVLG